MSKDVLADWKKNRFILADAQEIASGKHLVILSDIGYWAEHADELAEWCEHTPGVVTQGMTVEISDDKTLTHFILRWS